MLALHSPLVPEKPFLADLCVICNNCICSLQTKPQPL